MILLHLLFGAATNAIVARVRCTATHRLPREMRARRWLNQRPSGRAIGLSA